MTSRTACITDPFILIQSCSMSNLSVVIFRTVFICLERESSGFANAAS